MASDGKEITIVEFSDEDIKLAAYNWIKNPLYDDKGHRGSFTEGAKWMRSNMVSQESEAIDFAEWISKNYQKSKSTHDVWILSPGFDYTQFTTKELFTLYKNRI